MSNDDELWEAIGNLPMEWDPTDRSGDAAVDALRDEWQRRGLLAEPQATPVRLNTRHAREQAAARRAAAASVGIEHDMDTNNVLAAALPTEYFVNAMPVDETKWRQAQQLLDDAGHDDCAYVVPGDPATGKPIRHHIVTPPGVEIVVRMTADGERWEVGAA